MVCLRIKANTVRKVRKANTYYLFGNKTANCAYRRIISPCFPGGVCNACHFSVSKHLQSLQHVSARACKVNITLFSPALGITFCCLLVVGIDLQPPVEPVWCLNMHFPLLVWICKGAKTPWASANDVGDWIWCINLKKVPSPEFWWLGLTKQSKEG